VPKVHYASPKTAVEERRKRVGTVIGELCEQELSGFLLKEGLAQLRARGSAKLSRAETRRSLGEVIEDGPSQHASTATRAGTEQPTREGAAGWI
jgi:hypothetical protein